MALPPPEDFLRKVFSALKIFDLHGLAYPIDHLCYRVDTPARYAELKAKLSVENDLLVESLINGRPIATFRLQKPIVHLDRTVSLLELPSPKPGSAYPEGYEHLEFVLGEAPDQWIKQYPNLPWDRKGLDKIVNPDVRLPLGNGLSVKFHEHPLDYVIEFLD